MKKVLASFWFLSLLTSGFAQEDKTGFSVSVEAGIVKSNLYGSDVERETFLNGSYDNLYTNNPASDKSKSGIAAGLSLDYRFSRYFSLGLGAGYIEKGARINAVEYWNSAAQMYQEVDGKIFWKQNFWTLEVPVTVYIPIKTNDIYFQGGFSQGFLIKSEETGEISIDGSSGYSYENERMANEQDPGYFLGAGYLHSFSNSGSGLYAEMIWARSIKSPGKDMIPHSKEYLNQSISLNIGYRHKL